MRQAVVDVHFTVMPTESISACTSVTIGLIDACSIVLTRITRAFININVAGPSCITTLTSTLKIIQQICTNSFVQARVLLAFINVYFTVEPSNSLRTDTPEFINSVYTRPTIKTEYILAIVNIVLTLVAIESIWALACERV